MGNDNVFRAKGLAGIGEIYILKNDLDKAQSYFKSSINLNPKDEIPEAYIVPTIEDDVMEINIFIDEDFRNMMGDNTNIIWGSTYQNFKRYDFSNEYSKGIYINKVYDEDTERFRSGGNGANIFLGDATLEDVQSQNMDGITGVFLK